MDKSIWVLLGIAAGLGVLAYAMRPRQPLAAAALPAGLYKNAETWEITWSPDGFPTKVVIHRNATRT